VVDRVLLSARLIALGSVILFRPNFGEPTWRFEVAQIDRPGAALPIVGLGERDEVRTAGYLVPGAGALALNALTRRVSCGMLITFTTVDSFDLHSAAAGARSPLQGRLQGHSVLPRFRWFDRRFRCRRSAVAAPASRLCLGSAPAVGDELQLYY